MRLEHATFVMPFVPTKEFETWATVNFGAIVKNVSGDTFEIKPHRPGENIWGALNDIHKHREWVHTEEGKRALAVYTPKVAA